MTDIREMNALAVRDSMDIVKQVQVTDLTRPTPCAGWTLADLLGHMTVQHRGFAAAARGDGAQLAHWEFTAAGDDAVERYLAASEDVLAAFAALDDDLEFVLDLPEFKIDPPRFPARRAIGFHFIDYVVHAWDVAATLGVPYVLRPELEEPALEVALAVPNEDNRLADGAAFVPALDGADSGSPLDRVLRHLGRTPDWRPDEAV
ncbi:MAG: TIGR03086 family protein [Catenulispora sp. 13_1_20CM_3_70_7]|nr:TIGR03086 family protein [Catenulisporales bacterium]OLE27813.1 MAG: TIGR03086 family protein [Catenulispora sp. 13_1_20CM_3_70_7]